MVLFKRTSYQSPMVANEEGAYMTMVRIIDMRVNPTLKFI